MQITRMGSGHTANPRWSRDDRVILFNSWKPRSNLYTVDAADGSVKQLTHDDADDVEASWSRDGKWIYCGSNRSGRLEIYRLPASGGAPVPITRNGGLHAEESADRQWLYYSKDADSPTAIWKVPWDGGEEMPVVDGLRYSTNFALTDKGIYFVARNSNAIEFYDFATSKRKVLAKLEKAISWGIALSPDQRSLVYSLADHAASNLILVENFR
jgi:dipeptidyl aminopeptidase/acylaminoacyl peptidase